MTDLNTTLPPALGRALELLADPPAIPDVSKGYLDLLGARSVEDAALHAERFCAAGYACLVFRIRLARGAFDSVMVSPSSPR